MRKPVKSEKLTQRIKAYAAVAGSALAVHEAEAAIVYTDVSPDFSGGVGGQYFLDLNNDGTDDFRIFHSGFNNLYIEPLAANNEVLGSGGTFFAYPYALSYGNTISATAPGGWYNNGYSTGYQSLNFGSSGTFGNWVNVTDGYLGLRFEVGGNTHYGWCRMDVDLSGSTWVIKDYAYESDPGQSILAGELLLQADTAIQVMGLDIADANNASDIQYSFQAAANEPTVSEYRIMVVKESLAATFDTLAASAVLPSGYAVVTPTGASAYTGTLPATLADTDGNAIVNGQPYRLFVFSTPDGTIATQVNLSAPSPALLMEEAADVAMNLHGSDVSDQGNGADLQILYTKGADESTLSEYRALVMKSTATSGIDLAAAQALPAANYTVITPDGSGVYSRILGATARDTDGDLIANNIPYRVIIWSVADGVVATRDDLSEPSNEVTLKVTASLATNLLAEDVADNGDATDVVVQFTAAVNEATVSAYRAMLVKQSALSSFDLAAALAVPATGFVAVSPSGAPDYAAGLPAGTTDTDGDPITNGVPYVAVVLNMPDGVNASIPALSVPSNEITLEVYADEALSLVATDVFNHADGRDLQVEFLRNLSESNTAEYRVVVVKSALASVFDLTTAQTLGVSAYQTVVPDGSAAYTVTFGSSSVDAQGDLLEEGVPYRAFVWSVATPAATVDQLSQASNEVTLSTPVGLAELNEEEVNWFASNGSLVLDLSRVSATKPGRLTLYDLGGRELMQRPVAAGSLETIAVPASGMVIAILEVEGAVLRQRFLFP